MHPFSKINILPPTPQLIRSAPSGLVRKKSFFEGGGVCVCVCARATILCKQKAPDLMMVCST